jgi:cbb3-type cytochrome oxidase maturation protein
MEILIVLISISIAIAIFFVGVFIWIIKTGQYEDTYTPSVRVLFDDKKTDNKEPRHFQQYDKPTNTDPAVKKI